MAFYASISFDDREIILLRDSFRKAPERFARVFGRAALKAAQVIEHELEHTAPYDPDRKASDPGRHLVDAISSHARDYVIFGKMIKNASAVVGVWEPHSVFVEFGTRTPDRAPNPFFRRAVNASRQRAYDVLVSEVRRGMPSLSRR